MRSKPNRERIKVQIPIYGPQLKMDHDEEAALSLPPEFCVLEKLLMEDLRVEQAMGDTKARWDRRDMINNLQGNEIPDEEERTMEDLVAENEHLEVFNKTAKTFDARKLKAIKVKSNTKVYLPKGCHPREKAELKTGLG